MTWVIFQVMLFDMRLCFGTGSIWSPICFLFILWDGRCWWLHPDQAAAREVQQAPARNTHWSRWRGEWQYLRDQSLFSLYFHTWKVEVWGCLLFVYLGRWITSNNAFHDVLCSAGTLFFFRSHSILRLRKQKTIIHFIMWRAHFSVFSSSTPSVVIFQDGGWPFSTNVDRLLNKSLLLIMYVSS